MGVTRDGRSIIRFGDYELDPQAGVLRKNGMRIRCQEQPLQVLAALVERPGELVTREELRRRVWSQDTFVDFDHALNTAIKKIRASLNDDADSPRFVETVPRRGYRFVARIEPEAEPSAAPAGVAPARNNPRRILAAAGIAIFLLAILGLIWKFAPWHGDASTSPEFRRLTFDLPELGPGPLYLGWSLGGVFRRIFSPSFDDLRAAPGRSRAPATGNRRFDPARGIAAGGTGRAPPRPESQEREGARGGSRDIGARSAQRRCPARSSARDRCRRLVARRRTGRGEASGGPDPAGISHRQDSVRKRRVDRSAALFPQRGCDRIPGSSHFPRRSRLGGDRRSERK